MNNIFLNHGQMAYLYLLLVAMSHMFLSCDSISEIHNNDLTFTLEDSPHLISEDITTLIDQKLIVEPGVILIIDPGINIVAYGDILIEGTLEKPIIIKGSESEIGWGKISAKNETKNFVISHAMISDGIITSFNTNNNFTYVDFVNTQNLTWESAVARFWFGEVRIDHCTITGINKAEGFLFHDVDNPYVSNCVFNGTPDAVEFINSEGGIIEKNIFNASGDDGIDLNGCTDIIIRDNRFNGISDSGMEIGSENFGSSINIKCFDNYIVDCKKGIWIKESSELISERDSFIMNKNGLAIITHNDSIIVSKLVLKHAYFEGNDNDVDADQRSSVKIEN